MTKATTSKSVMLSVRVPNALHELIMVKCDTDAATVGATVIGLLERGFSMGRRSDAVPVLHRQIDGLNEAGDAMRKAIAVKDARIVQLEKALADAPKHVASVVPLTGTDAPVRPLGSLLKTPTKGKGKR